MSPYFISLVTDKSTPWKDISLCSPISFAAYSIRREKEISKRYHTKSYLS